jgi:uncharacterized protein YecE (DUF72 family)
VAIHIGTAGWNIPRAHRDRFPARGAQLERYAWKLNGAEINTSFYRPHARTTYEKWAAVVPVGFKFAVKMPKVISHERLLLRVREPLERFLDEVDGLGGKLGPLLLQLPPSFAFNPRTVGRFLELLRKRHAGGVVCEPRHATWSRRGAERLLERFEVARVASDPARASGLDVPGGWPGLTYFRCHGSPRMYFSTYSPEWLTRLAETVGKTPSGTDAWCIFDNTGSGAAAGNAVELDAILRDPRENQTR